MRAAKTTSKMTISEFLDKNPQVSRLAGITDEQLELLSKIDLSKLSVAISKSGFLRSRRSFGWLITHYDDIIAGGYGDWGRYSPAARPRVQREEEPYSEETYGGGIGAIIEGNTIKSKEFALARTYTKEYLASLVDDIETVEL